MGISNEDSVPNLAQRFYVYREESQCAQPDLPLAHDRDIPSSPRGNCLFFSLIKILRLNTSPGEVRAKLLESPTLASCGDPLEACRILSDINEYADADCLYTFSQEYKQNVCVHFHADDRVIFLHYRANENPEFIYLHLMRLHYTPYFPVTEDTPGRLERNIASEGAMDETQVEKPLPTPTHPTGLMTCYLVGEARPLHMLPPCNMLHS